MTRTSVRLSMTAALALGAALLGAAEEAAHLSQLTNPKGLDDPLLRWNAFLVMPQGKPDPQAEVAGDYAATALSDAWDFDEKDFEGITRFSDGIIKPRVEDGKLKFTVGEKPFFYWGDHFDDPGVKGLSFGADWPCGPMETYLRWAVKARVRQSAAESEWTISARRAGSRPALERKVLKVKGTEWQEITAEFRFGRAGIGTPARRRHSVCIEPKGKGNQIQVDWVKLTRVGARKYIRKVLQLDRKVTRATICIVPTFVHALYVNGKEVASGLPRGWSVADCSEHFRVGENVIAYEDEAVYRSSKEAALEGCLHFEDGSLQRVFTDKSWKGSFKHEEGWSGTGFDDSHWQNVRQGVNVANSHYTIQRIKDKQTGRDCARGYGIFLDPPYLGPLSLSYPDKETPDDTPAFFPVETGARIRLALPVRSPPVDYALDYRLQDAFTDSELESGSLSESEVRDGRHVYELTVDREKPGVYDLIVTARQNGQLLDRRFEELALIGEIPQREVAWRDVDREVGKRLIAEVNCGDPETQFDYIEHPAKNYQKGAGPPASPMTEIEKEDGKAYRVLSDGYGDWVAWKIPMSNHRLPHLLEVEYPDDRPQSFTAYARDRTMYYNRSFGAQVPRRGAVWCLNDPKLFPLTNGLRRASFIFYPQSTYPYLSVELMNMFRDGRRSAVHRIRVYEITDLPRPKIASRQDGRWFGSQTERAALRAITYYNGFYGGADAKLFANIYRCRLNRHYGFVRDWYLTYSNMIQRMRFAGENMFMCGFWMYYAPFWTGSKLGRRATTQNYDNFALMFAMFGANDMFLLPWIEYCSSINISKSNLYTDKEVAEGAPTPLVVSKDGHQAAFSAAGTNPYSVLNPTVQEDLLEVVRELGSRYGRYKGFRGIAFTAGGFCLPSLHNVPKALTWEENLEWGWEDEAIRLFEKTTGMKIPVSFDDPKRFAKRYKWVMDSAREHWVGFRKQALTSVHRSLAQEVRKFSSDANYYLFAIMPGSALMKATTLEHRDFASRLEEAGLSPKAIKQEENIHLSWIYRPESFGVANRLKPGLCKAFNGLDQVNETLDNGESTGCFLDVVWQEPDYGNFLYKDWVWQGATQNNPNPWFSGLHYPTPFTDRLSEMTPGLMGFCLTDGLLYTAQNSPRRPVGVAYQSIPKGQYRTLEGKGLDRNVVVRESVSDGRRAFYVVNPVWWKAEATIKLSGDTEVSDLVNGDTMRGHELKLSLQPYDVRVFQIPADTDIASADTEVEPKAIEWLKARIDCFRYLDRLGVKKTLRGFSLPEPMSVSVTRLSHLRHLFHNGEYLKAQKCLYHPWVVRVMDFLRDKRQIDEAGGVKIRDTYRVNVGSNQPYRDSRGHEWLPDQDFRSGALSYGFLDSEEGKTIYRGRERKVAGTPDPEIYRSERFGHPGHGFLVPDGTYTVRIHFAETFRHRPDLPFTDSGITINGREIYPSFNMGNEAGGKDVALIKTITDVKAVDGRIEIRFTDLKNGGRYQGLEVIRGKD